MGKKQRFVLTGDFIEEYEGRRLEIQCTNGDVLRGRVGQEDQADFHGFFFRDVERNGEKLPHDLIVKDSKVASYTPIKDENP